MDNCVRSKMRYFVQISMRFFVPPSVSEKFEIVHIHTISDRARAELLHPLPAIPMKLNYNMLT